MTPDDVTPSAQPPHPCMACVHMMLAEDQTPKGPVVVLECHRNPPQVSVHFVPAAQAGFGMIAKPNQPPPMVQATITMYPRPPSPCSEFKSREQAEQEAVARMA